MLNDLAEAIRRWTEKKLRLPSGPAGIRTTTGSLSVLARPTPTNWGRLCGKHAISEAWYRPLLGSSLWELEGLRTEWHMELMQLAQINLYLCSSRETVRDEHAKPEPTVVCLLRFWTSNVHFVQKGCVSWRSGGSAPALRENRRRARGDLQIWGCADLDLHTLDLQMWGCEDLDGCKGVKI